MRLTECGVLALRFRSNATGVAADDEARRSSSMPMRRQLCQRACWTPIGGSHEVRHHAGRARRCSRPRPSIGAARSRWRLHVRGSARCVHPADPGCRCDEDLELATNVAIVFPRNPVQLAHQAYDLQLLSGGRFTLGLGSQIRAQVEKRYGASFDRPVARMREVVGAFVPSSPPGRPGNRWISGVSSGRTLSCPRSSIPGRTPMARHPSPSAGWTANAPTGG